MYKILKLIRKKYLDQKIKLSDSKEKSRLYRKYFGITIGENVRFTGTPFFGPEAFLIEIGNNVTITQNVTFHTHDGGVGLFREEYPGINIFGKIIIGNNVFIGSHSIFLPGVKIGNNVVIATGSIISKNIPDNCVVAGVPARIIKSIDEYKNKSLENAIFINEKEFMKRKEEILIKMKG